jgi:hypothetical protein
MCSVRPKLDSSTQPVDLSLAEAVAILKYRDPSLAKLLEVIFFPETGAENGRPN